MDLPFSLPIPDWLAGILTTLVVVKYLLPNFIQSLDRGLARRASKSLGLDATSHTDTDRQGRG